MLIQSADIGHIGSWILRTALEESSILGASVTICLSKVEGQKLCKLALVEITFGRYRGRNTSMLELPFCQFSYKKSVLFLNCYIELVICFFVFASIIFRLLVQPILQVIRAFRLARKRELLLNLKSN